MFTQTFNNDLVIINYYPDSDNVYVVVGRGCHVLSHSSLVTGESLATFILGSSIEQLTGYELTTMPLTFPDWVSDAVDFVRDCS